ncbi:hypothetical protein Ciccas_004253 [Cichlidogyrus casuarinus]|uniref:Uncharacterized protein n=1 Tax=Cichlidogyrus casuarinus TaxID=1844966 RepID=A0ABD2QCZ6_9PLAT
MAHNLRVSSLRHKLTLIWEEIFNLPLSDTLVLTLLDYLGPKNLLDRCSEASLLANYIFAIFDPQSFQQDESDAIRCLVNSCDESEPVLVPDFQPINDFDTFNFLGSSLWEAESLLRNPAKDVTVVVKRMLEPLDITKMASNDDPNSNLDLVERPISKIVDSSTNARDLCLHKMRNGLIHLYRSNNRLPKLAPLPGWTGTGTEADMEMEH